MPVRLLGKWLFRLYLMLLLAMIAPVMAIIVTVEKLMRWTELPWKTRFGDRLMGSDSIVLPALKKSLDDDFEQSDDGPGWSEQQIPKLWGTCRALAQQLGCPPPDAIHLSVEPGDCLAWQSKALGGPARRHIALSLLDLRLVSHDEARAVIAHEIVHAGFDHSPQSHDEFKQDMLMSGTIGTLPFPVTVPIYVARALFAVGAGLASHDMEREADRKAAQVVGGNHAKRALERIILQSPVLERVFTVIFLRAELGEHAPIRIAEAAYQLYRRYDWKRMHDRAETESMIPGPQHPSLPERAAGADKAESRTGIGGDRAFIDAYPELLVAEELLTKTYFPDKKQHQRSDASQLRRKALAARLKRR